MFVDSHPDGLVLSDPEPVGRGGAGGFGRLLAIVVVLVVSALSAGLLAVLD